MSKSKKTIYQKLLPYMLPLLGIFILFAGIGIGIITKECPVCEERICKECPPEKVYTPVFKKPSPEYCHKIVLEEHERSKLLEKIMKEE